MKNQQSPNKFRSSQNQYDACHSRKQESRQPQSTQYEDFIFNYLLANKETGETGQMVPGITTVSSQFALENFFSASPILGGEGGGGISTTSNSLMYLDSTQKHIMPSVNQSVQFNRSCVKNGFPQQLILDKSITFEAGGDYLNPDSSMQSSAQNQSSSEHESSYNGNNRSRERRSRLNRMSREKPFPSTAVNIQNICQPPSTTMVRESIDELMRQIQNKPSPEPQPQPVSTYADTLKEDAINLQQRQLQLAQAVEVQTYNHEQIQFFRETVAAKKIQRVIRAFLLYKRIKQQRLEHSAERRRKIQLQKILAAKVIVRHVKKWLAVRRARSERKLIIDKIIKVQRCWKRKLILLRLAKFKRVKGLLYGVFLGWKTRRIINSLAKEIQEYVNNDDFQEKAVQKGIFLSLYDSVVQNSLWLSKNHKVLKNLKKFHLQTLSGEIFPNQQQQAAQPLNNNNRILRSGKHVKTKSANFINGVPNKHSGSKGFKTSDLFEEEYLNKPICQEDIQRFAPVTNDIYTSNPRYIAQQEISKCQNNLLAFANSNNPTNCSNNYQTGQQKPITINSTFESFSDQVQKASFELMTKKVIMKMPVDTRIVSKNEGISQKRQPITQKESQISTNIPVTLVGTPRGTNEGRLVPRSATNIKAKQINESKNNSREYSASRQTLASTLSQAKPKDIANNPQFITKELYKATKRIKNGATASMDWEIGRKSSQERPSRAGYCTLQQRNATKKGSIEHQDNHFDHHNDCQSRQQIIAATGSVTSSLLKEVPHERRPVMSANHQQQRQQLHQGTQQNYKKTLSQIEKLMDDVQSYQQTMLQMSKNTHAKQGHLNRPTIACEFDVSALQLIFFFKQKLINKLKHQMNNMLNQADPKFAFQ